MIRQLILITVPLFPFSFAYQYAPALNSHEAVRVYFKTSSQNINRLLHCLFLLVTFGHFTIVSAV